MEWEGRRRGGGKREIVESEDEQAVGSRKAVRDRVARKGAGMGKVRLRSGGASALKVERVVVMFVVLVCTTSNACACRRVAVWSLRLVARCPRNDSPGLRFALRSRGCRVRAGAGVLRALDAGGRESSGGRPAFALAGARFAALRSLEIDAYVTDPFA